MQSETFRKALADELRRKAARESELVAFASALTRFNCPGQQTCGHDRPAVVEAYLESLLSGLESGTPLSDAIRHFAENSDWMLLLDGAPVDDRLVRGLAVARPSYPPIDPLPALFGLFLIGPGVPYPLHNHAAREIYHVVSGEISITHGREGQPVLFRTGETSVTPEHRVHALETRERPCMIAYVWVGDINGRAWWWTERKAGSWTRTLWEREGNTAWRILKDEVVTPDMLAQAGEL